MFAAKLKENIFRITFAIKNPNYVIDILLYKIISASWNSSNQYFWWNPKSPCWFYIIIIILTGKWKRVLDVANEKYFHISSKVKCKSGLFWKIRFRVMLILLSGDMDRSSQRRCFTKKCSQKFRKIHRKTPTSESLF